MAHGSLLAEALSFVSPMGNHPSLVENWSRVWKSNIKGPVFMWSLCKQETQSRLVLLLRLARSNKFCSGIFRIILSYVCCHCCLSWFRAIQATSKHETCIRIWVIWLPGRCLDTWKLPGQAAHIIVYWRIWTEKTNDQVHYLHQFLLPFFTFRLSLHTAP